jgi:hypothetical protein
MSFYLKLTAMLSCALLLGACGGASDSPAPIQNIQVTLQPQTAEIRIGGHVFFNSSVSGDNKAVSFAVDETGGGTILPSGEYTAPSQPGTYHVTVTSQADPSKKARATIFVGAYENRVTAANNMPGGRSHHATAVLMDHSILFIGGTTNDVFRFRPQNSQFELVDTKLSGRRFAHTVSALDDGRVLVLGGETSQTASQSAITDIPEIYEPLVGPISALTSKMVEGRRSHTATALQNGRLLIVGGKKSQSGIAVGVSSSEIFDRRTQAFVSGPTLPSVRFSHTATLLKDGRVLIAGGDMDCGTTCPIASSLIYDPAAGAFLNTGNLNEPRFSHSATLLQDGRVLIAGGYTLTGIPALITEASTYDIYDPSTGLFTSAGPMREPRAFHTATLLNDGRVLIAGGQDSFSNATDATETFDPRNGIALQGPQMTTARVFHSAHLLPDGRVLIVGGLPNSATPLATAEFFY